MFVGLTEARERPGRPEWTRRGIRRPLGEHALKLELVGRLGEKGKLGEALLLNEGSRKNVSVERGGATFKTYEPASEERV